MKTSVKLSTIVVAIIATFCSYTNSHAQESNPIVGVWQQCRIKSDNDEKAIIEYNPVMKVINSDNTYLVILNVKGENFPGVITQKGEYEIIDDNTYHEKIIRHMAFKNMEGTISTMEYKFLDDNKNTMLIIYSNDAAGGAPQTEYWFRYIPAYDTKVELVLSEKR